MLASSAWLDATRITGTVAYALAALCCVIVWAKAKPGSRLARIATIFTVAEAALLLDMVLNIRWVIHQALMDAAKQRNAYGSRRGPQEVVLALLAGALVLGLFLMWRRFRPKAGILLASLGLMFSLALWCSEVISLHQTDSVLQHRVGPWMAVSLLWALACLMTSVGILIESRNAKTRMPV